MTFYFGKPALGLVALPHPLTGLTPTNDRLATTHASSSGGRTVDFASRTRRTFALAWKAIDAVTYSVLEEFFTGARGPGPFVLLDPGRRNHLTANQSGATSQTNDPTGFVVAAGSGESVSSSPGPVLRGPRALRWTLPGSVTSGVLALTAPAGLVGFPVPAGTPWTFSGQLSSAGIAPSVAVTPVLSWRRLDGSEVAATLGTPVNAVTGSFAAFNVSLGAPPAGALFVVPQLRVAAGVLTTAQVGADVNDWGMPARRPFGVLAGFAAGAPNRALVSSYASSRDMGAGSVLVERPAQTTTDVVVDQLQLDMFASVRTWALGTGMPQVSITALPEQYQILPDRNVTATLVEVG